MAIAGGLRLGRGALRERPHGPHVGAGVLTDVQGSVGDVVRALGCVCAKTVWLEALSQAAKGGCSLQ